MVAINNSNALDLGAYFHRARRAFELEILDQYNAITIVQYVAVRIFDNAWAIFFGCFSFDGPFETAVSANEVGAVGVGVFKGALRASWSGHNRDSSEKCKTLLYRLIKLVPIHGNHQVIDSSVKALGVYRRACRT